MMRSNLRILAVPLGAALLVVACASNRGLKQLDPKSRDFISKVRYTINSEERKAFLALPAEAREPFIEDFWRRRDPTPGTPENEYRTEYYNRIERSNRLFSGGGSPGWLQDRGRVYITLGPPDNRITYPRGVTFYGLPTEIWWYGLYTILFIDQYWNDDYRLSPESAGQIAVINQAQREWNLPKRDGPAGRGALRVRHPGRRGRDRGRRRRDGPLHGPHPVPEHLAEVVRQAVSGRLGGGHEGRRHGRHGGLVAQAGVPHRRHAEPPERGPGPGPQGRGHGPAQVRALHADRRRDQHDRREQDHDRAQVRDLSHFSLWPAAAAAACPFRAFSSERALSPRRL
ncbi:MAG: GWxTD domain-containing protein [Candidatus Aminicenantes bacterium]|nr:MAG: GWxTD domain-containing protein [Candidatus Aminicenantes bacterium]